MSEHQPLLQIGTPLRETDPGYVILRLEDDQDVVMALAIINEVNEKLAPLMVGLADTVSRLMRDGTGNVTGQLQAAGLNPVPMAAPQTPAPPVYPQQPMQAGPPQPVYQPQAQASQAYAPAPQQMAQAPAPAQSTPLTGPCWAASPRKMHNSECKDCGRPSYLTTRTLRSGKVCNGHVCIDNPQHKITWCEETIWNSKVATANGQGIMTDPNLVTG